MHIKVIDYLKFRKCGFERRAMVLWLEVSKDKYALPVAVYDSVKELSKAAGVTENSIRSYVSKYDNGKINKCRFRRVVVDEVVNEKSNKRKVFRA